MAVKQLKLIKQRLLPLQIPGNGKRVLQINASDEFRGAVLLEEKYDGTRRIFGYNSGQFNSNQDYYHSTSKEILVIKNAIKKFEFHLIGHHSHKC